jgi:SET domain
MRPPNEDLSQGSPGDTEEQEFLSWCRLALGIETSLEIHTFQYYDYMKALPDQDWEQDDATSDDDWKGKQATTTLPMIAVRGLAATRDISVGEVVIRIPLQALFSVTTTIDKDPVLGPVIGLESRQRRGWDLDAPPLSDDANPADEEGIPPTLIEIPLLAVALLHHKRLGSASSLAPYIRVLNRTPVDTIPFLWDKTKLRTLSEGIRTVARGVKRDMKAMYERVVKVLIAEHPQVFDNGAFKYENFEWAFAIVNSRHWQLPVQDMQGTPVAAQAAQRRMLAQHRARSPDEDVLGQLPPADMPTEAWVDATQQGHQSASPNALSAGAIPKHSFLAPLADLLNFGPPCTTGSYNRDAHTFEIVASCEFRKGQEVTFWYSDECDHVMVGLYGFMHPMIPPCPSAEEYKRASGEWRRRAEELDAQLAESNQDLYRLDREASHLAKLLRDCDCQNYKDEIKAREDQDRMLKTESAHGDMEPSRLRHEHVRGGIADREDLERRGVRKATRDRDTEF